jgi:hypothetical protein
MAYGEYEVLWLSWGYCDDAESATLRRSTVCGDGLDGAEVAATVVWQEANNDFEERLWLENEEVFVEIGSPPEFKGTYVVALSRRLSLGRGSSVDPKVTSCGI